MYYIYIHRLAIVSHFLLNYSPLSNVLIYPVNWDIKKGCKIDGAV